MKPKLLLFLLVFFLLSCNKGEVLSNDLDVQFIESNNTHIYPTGAFPHFNPSDPGEIDVYPQFVNYASPAQINTNFKDDLKNFLKKNKIHLVDDSTTYRLVINSITYTESNNREAYVDSCQFGNPSLYVYYSDYKVTASASLFKGNVKVADFTESDSGCERLKTSRDDCNKPEIGFPFQSLSCVATNVAKKIRARVSTKLKELVG